jgi:hypothetical protein
MNARTLPSHLLRAKKSQVNTKNVTNNSNDQQNIQTNEVKMVQNKYIVLFKPYISLENLTLKNVNKLNNLNVEFMITNSSNDKLDTEILKNSISGFIITCSTGTEDYNTQIQTIITTIIDVLEVELEQLEYNVNQCTTKLLGHALGTVKENNHYIQPLQIPRNDIYQTDNTIRYQQKPVSNTMRDMSRNERISSRNNNNDKQPQPNPAKMQKAMLRKKYLV